MGLKIDLNLKFDDVNLDKLYNDATKGSSTGLATGDPAVSSGFDSGTSGQSGSNISTTTENLDLSTFDETGISPPINKEVPNPKLDDNLLNNGSQNSPEQVEEAKSSSINTSNDNNSNTSETELSSDKKNNESSNINPGSKTSGGNDSKGVSGAQQTGMGGQSSSAGGGGSSAGSSSSGDLNTGDISIDMDSVNNSSDAENPTIDNKKVVSSDSSTNKPENISEIDVENYITNLRANGLRQIDIDRVLSGKISIEDLLKEIESDFDNSRRQEIMQAVQLQSYNLNFVSLAELNLEIESLESQLKLMTDQRKKLNNDREMDALFGIITRLQLGESLDLILETEYVGYKYIDKDGNVELKFDKPDFNFQTDGGEYIPITFEEMYQNSELLKELKSLIEINGESFLWNGTDAANNYFIDYSEKYRKLVDQRAIELKELDPKIKELYEKIETYKYINGMIESKIAHYINNVDAYINKTDFNSNSEFNTESLKIIDDIRKKYEDDGFVYGEDSGVKTEYVNNKSDLVNLISCMINGNGNISNGTLLVGPYAVQIFSDDSILRHYEKWKFFISEEEKSVFNYIFNTDGIDAAYKYLEDISGELDNRWLANKTREDQEFAQEHPLLASLASIIVTPFEGISAAIFSINALANAEKIRRSDVYSSGNIWRAKVASDLARDHGEGLAFVYNTAMSMSDTGILIALSAATGGTITPVLSAALMGSRSYVSTLNDALDRGLSDSDAVLLAASSAVVESAMESLSVGHLLNLEKNLGKVVIKLTGKIANNIKNETAARLITKAFYVAAFSLSQGIVEGEEEFTTEIVNYLADIIISKDLSKYSMTIQKYLDQGFTEDEALYSTVNELKGQAVQAFLGGFVSGICFGAYGGISSTIRTSDRIASKMYNDLKGITPAQQFASAVEINQMEADKQTLKKPKNEEIKLDKLANERETNIPDLEINSEEINAPDLGINSEEINAPDLGIRLDETSGNDILLQYINTSITDHKSLVAELGKIKLLTDSTIPPSFSSLVEYKQAFVKMLLKSGKLDNLNNGATYEICKDPIMLKELIGTEKLNNLLERNLKELPKLLVPVLSSLSINDFNQLFELPSMKNYIEKLSASDLGNILSVFEQTDKLNLSWLSNEAIINKIISLETKDFYVFVKKLGYYSNQISKFLNAGNDSTLFVKLLDAVLNKFYNEDIVLGNTEYLEIINNIAANNGGYDFDSALIISKINDISEKIHNKINNAFQSSSDIELIQRNRSLVVQVDPNKFYYDLIIEIDGKIDKMTLKQDGRGFIDLTYSIKNKPYYSMAALNGNLKILGIEVNQNRSNLVLRESDGLVLGLNEVTLLLNGVERKIMVNAKNKTEDLGIKLKREISSYTDIKVKSIVSIGTRNTYVSDGSSIYNVHFTIGDKIVEAFIKPGINYSSSPMAHLTLDLDDYISKYNLMGITNISYNIADLEQIQENVPSIQEFNASSDVFTTDKFGGNQSDVTSLLEAFINGTSLTQINTQKGILLNNLIDKYFPNVTNTDKIKLASHYASGGCMWMAVSNAFATYIGSIENGSKIFSNKIGFDLAVTDGNNTSYNLEALAFDMYLSYFSQEFSGSFDQLIENKVPAGISTMSFEERIVNYFFNRGITINTNIVAPSSKSNSFFNELLASILDNKKGFNILVAKNFDLKKNSNNQNGTNSQVNTDELMTGIGGHAMLITKITKELIIEVSSWSKKFDFMINSIFENVKKGIEAYASIVSINFSIPDIEIISSPSINVSESNDESIDSIFSAISNLFAPKVDSQTIQYVTNVISTMDKLHKQDPTTYDTGIRALEGYLTKGNENFITRQNNSREYIKSLPKETLKLALEQIKNGSNVQSAKVDSRIDSQTIQYVTNVITTMDKLHKQDPTTYDTGIRALEGYLTKGNENFITRQNNCREYIKSLSKETLSLALEQIKNGGTVQPTKVEVQTKPKYTVRHSVNEVDAAAVVQINSLENLSLIEKAINKGGDAYHNIVSILSNNIKKKFPNNIQINNFVNRFSIEKYGIHEQNSSFYHVWSRDFNRSNASRKLYLNNSDLSDSIKFVTLFSSKCEAKGIPFYFKIPNLTHGIENMSSFGLIRDESIVIYSSEENLSEYVNICNEVKYELNMEFLNPPLLSGVIDGFIGCGADPKGGYESYNSIRSILMEQAVFHVNDGLKAKYPDYDINYILENIRKDSKNYEKYLYEIKKYIETNAIRFRINPTKFFLNL